jgi:hypothetical protein
MFSSIRNSSRIVRAVSLPLVLLAAIAVGQPRAVSQTHTAAGPVPVTSEKDLAATQEELIRLLRLSPTLTTVVARDPSLLSNQDYVRRNNPELAQYLGSHPEIALNPDFYLFTHLENSNGQRDQALERAVWPEYSLTHRDPSAWDGFVGDLPPMLVFVCILAALVWFVRQFLENRRWGRVLKLQMEVHGKLIDRLGSNQELLAYMETEAGKRFLEAAPIAVGFEQELRVPNAVARVLTPLQIGIVLSLLGVGFLILRQSRADMNLPMQVFGTLFLMPGLGFILSAGITWVLAGRLGLMPENHEASNRLAPPLDLPGRQ